MRILSVTAYWPPHRGGIETVAWEQARRLTRRGHEVTVLTSRLPGDPQLSTADGFPVHRVAADNTLEKRRGIPYPVFSHRLLSLLGRLVPAHELVLVHNHTYMSSVVAASVARFCKRPSILLQYSPYVQYRFPWNVVEHGADFLLGSYALRSARRVLAISEHTRQYVQRLIGNRPVDLLHLGVDTERFTPVPSPSARKALRERLGLPTDAFVLFTVRRLVFRNGIDTLLAACARLKDRKDIVVVVGGRGPERAAMERLIRDEGLTNVRLAGFVPDDLLPDYYRAADAFVLPSRTGEGFGLVLLEAAASGLPAIATRGGGQEEVIRPGRNGLLIAPDAPDALADSILALRADPDRTHAMGRIAREIAVEMDWERSVDNLTEVLTSAVRAA